MMTGPALSIKYEAKYEMGRYQGHLGVLGGHKGVESQSVSSALRPKTLEKR